MNGIGSGSGAVQVVQKVDSMEPSYVANPAGTAPRSHNGELSMGLESSLIIQVNGAGVCQVDPHIVTLCVPSSQFVQPSHNLDTNSIVYTASPIDDPNAFKGAVVVSPGIQYPSSEAKEVDAQPDPEPQDATPAKEKVKKAKGKGKAGPVGKKSKKGDPMVDPSRKVMFECCYQSCGFQCTYAEEMRDHTLQHLCRAPFRCLYPGCDFVSKVYRDTVYHREYHTGKRPFRCTVPRCGFAAPNPSQLRLHMHSHSDKRPYKCSFENCSYASRYKSALINHERVHTGETPFKCMYCKSYAAKQMSGLRYHIRRVHLLK
ncbi:hypothetical protein JH06_1181 [Blastocystis sp. subtype 4]|uniref:hypothetical protein n=1 Tax=Blastocystis sp. subtype 4 TaxID=944170 RepID=UPI000711E7CF|nr:hypothetical protein JH06_1181 [Blastocystis sp. subtype 4]KNB45607.1 hypothetical protein JH06_1181 [Blastocystis sp. subtype 4]|eukprot:XP_014529050.1 hypothetical protein JH06_1181 [Blastocystis sp. subtype 4]